MPSHCFLAKVPHICRNLGLWECITISTVNTDLLAQVMLIKMYEVVFELNTISLFVLPPDLRYSLKMVLQTWRVVQAMPLYHLLDRYKLMDAEFQYSEQTS